jgi:mono/diheme cytochrome c family protein
MRHPDGAWGGFTYEWNSAQTEATLLQGGAERDVGADEPWIFPSETQCLECHTSAAGRSLGLETAQLNGDHTYPSTGRVANQLYTLSHIEVLTPPVANPATRPSIPDPTDGSTPLDERARAYLHTNCSFCHRPGGTTPSAMDLRYTTALADANACDVSPQSGDLDIGGNARIIAPGNAPASVLVNRMNRRDEHAMPPLGSNQIDTEGVALITEWVNGLGGCD